MATGRRRERLNRTLMKEIADAISTKVMDPRLTSMVSVLDAQISTNMRHVKVIVSIYGGTEKNKKKSLKALKASAGYISSVVSQNMRFHFAPSISFEASDSIEKGMDIYYKLKELKDDEHNKDDNS